MNPILLTPLVVVVTATAGFRHPSIQTAEEVIPAIAAQMRFDVAFARTEEEMIERLSADALKGAALVMFVNTTGELPPQSRIALLAWIRGGGSFIGVHSASDTWHEWPEYIEMLGGEFDHHPDQTMVTVLVDRDHPATAGLESYDVFEEIYLFRNFDRSRVTMLLSLNASPEDGSIGFFPIAWFKTWGDGRVLYTALGHREDVWTTEWFQRHLRGAISWGLRRDELPRRRAVRSR